MKAQMFKWSGWITETDPESLYTEYRQELLDSGFKIVGECVHYFSPFGYTALFLLAESHFAIHTFPEEGRTYLELTSCVERQYETFLRRTSLREKAEGADHV